MPGRAGETGRYQQVVRCSRDGMASMRNGGKLTFVRYGDRLHRVVEASARACVAWDLALGGAEITSFPDGSHLILGFLCLGNTA